MSDTPESTPSDDAGTPATSPAATKAAAKKAAANKPATKKAPANKPATKKAPAKKAAAKKAPAKKPAATTAATSSSAAAASGATSTSAPAAPAAPAPEAPPAPAPPQQPASATPAPQLGYQPMLESEARNISMLVHVLAAIAALLSGGTLAFVVPLVMWLIYRERSALVDFHGKQNLNLQLTFLAVLIGGTVLGIVTLGFGFLLTLPLMVAYGIYVIVISIIAGIAANKGEYYRIPVSIPFIL